MIGRGNHYKCLWTYQDRSKTYEVENHGTEKGNEELNYK